jgi:hypothetical protein
VALRLGLQVSGVPTTVPLTPLQLPSTPSTPPSQQQQQQLGRRLVTRGSSDAQQQQQQQVTHSFEVGVHLNLTQLMGLPSTRHPARLSAERSGFGKSARGVLLIGDLNLNPGELVGMHWRPPPLGLGVVPVPPTAPLSAAAVAEPSAVVVVEEGGEQGTQQREGSGSSSSSSSSK